MKCLRRFLRRIFGRRRKARIIEGYSVEPDAKRGK